MRQLFFVLVLLLELITSKAVLAAYNDSQQGYLHSYRILLSHYVAQGTKQGIETALVNYTLWRADPLHRETIQLLSNTDLEKLAGNQKKAFWLNAYNLLTVDLIIKTGELSSIKNQGSLLKNVWKKHRWKIHSKYYTLDEIEHEILRPMGDPRIHMAINCASLSCPDLRYEPYYAEQLDGQLHDQVKTFLQNSEKGFVQTSSGLKVSNIFNWFAEDFGGTEGVVTFILHYVPAISGSVEIRDYLDYNWQLNNR